MKLIQGLASTFEPFRVPPVIGLILVECYFISVVDCVGVFISTHIGLVFKKFLMQDEIRPSTNEFFKLVKDVDFGFRVSPVIALISV